MNPRSISHWGLVRDVVGCAAATPVARLKSAAVGQSAHAKVQVLAGDLSAVLGLPIEEGPYGVQIVREV